jgi:hypothetical protein
MEARTSDSSLSISFTKLVKRRYKLSARSLTLFRMRSEHLESCWFDAVEARQSQSSTNALQQLTFCKLRILWRRLDIIWNVLHMA